MSDWQADVEARTIGAQAHNPVVYNGRWPDVDTLWDIPRISSYPFQGSAIVYWDGGPVRPDPANPSDVLGTDPPPLGNVPNRSGKDPHSLPRATPAEQQMVSDFLRPDRAQLDLGHLQQRALLRLQLPPAPSQPARGGEAGQRRADD